MATQKTPMQTVNDQHGGKEKLIDKLTGLLDSDDKDSLKARLTAASNKKLLKLLDVAETVKKKYGSPAKLAEAVAAGLGRAKDTDYVKKLSEYTPARLLDMAQSFAKRAARKAKS